MIVCVEGGGVGIYISNLHYLTITIDYSIQCICSILVNEDFSITKWFYIISFSLNNIMKVTRIINDIVIII